MARNRLLYVLVETVDRSVPSGDFAPARIDVLAPSEYTRLVDCLPSQSGNGRWVSFLCQQPACGLPPRGSKPRPYSAASRHVIELGVMKRNRCNRRTQA